MLLLFLSVCVFNYFEMNPLGKKIGLSILALNLLINEAIPFQNWLLLFNIVVGALCAIVGNILPWPRLAYVEIDKRALFSAECVGAVFEDIVIAWRYSVVPIQKSSGIAKKSSTNLLLHLHGFSWEDPGVKIQHRLWKLLRNVLLAISAFRKRHTGMLWSAKYSHHKNNLHMRLELMRFVSEVLESMQTLYADAKFGPRRIQAIFRYNHFFSMIRDLCLVLSIMEQRLRDIRHNPQHHHIIFAFQNRPEFRAAVSKYVSCLSAAIHRAGEWIHQPRLFPDKESMKVLAALHMARGELDEEYVAARVDIYYHSDHSKCKPMSSFVAMNLNSFMFLFDASFSIVSQFWDVFAKEQDAGHTDAVSEWRRTLKDIQSDLFPSQSHLFQFRSWKPSPHMLRRFRQSISLALSMAIAGMCRTSAVFFYPETVTLSIAGIYGYYARRAQVFMAAFTIAYLR